MSGKVDSTKPVTTRKISFQTLESNGTAEKESRVANRMRQSLSKDFATLHLEDKSGEFNHDGGLLSQLSISNSALQEEPKIEMQERKGLAKISFIEQQLDDQRRGSVESSEPAESEDGSESNNVIVCRICEEKVAQDCLSEHSQYCVALRQCINKIQEYDDMLLQNLALLEKTLVNLTNTQPANNETTLKRIQFLELTKKMIQTTINQLVTVNDIEDVRVAWEDYQNNSQNLESHLIDEDQKLKGAITHLLGSKTKTIRRKSVSSTKRKEVSYVVRPDKSGKGKLSRAFIKSTINVGVTPSIRDFAMVKKLSRGAYGRVYLAMKKTTKDYFAIKVINKKHMVNKTQVERILAERDILAQVDSPFIVKLYYSFQTVENLYMVMEYLNGGDILSLLDTVGKFPEAWAQFYMAELTAALAHLHSLGIVHRDIKPHNLLIDKRGHMKLADFGLSRRNDKQNSSIADADEVNKLLNNAGPLDEQDLELDENVNRMRDFDNDFETVDKTMKRANSFVGTPEYLAPEVIMGSGYDESVDWWGVGVVTFQLMTGKQPFYDDTSDQVTFENILYRRITWPKYLSFEAKDFIDSLLTVDVSDRLGAHGSKEIASHPFFKNINWKDLDVIEPSFVPMVENPEDTRYFKDMEWSDNSLNSQSKEKPSGEGDTANEVNFVDFAYTNVNMLKAANEEAKDKSTAMNFIKWMDDDAEPRTKCGTKSDGLKKTSSTLTSKNDITNDVKELRCLVAEDNPIVLKVAQALLKTLGFITETVDNGLKALNAAEDHHFDLIFMDIMMPEMDGLEATKRIRAGNGPNKNTVVVAFTAMADTVGETREQFLAHGMNDTLPKPFTKGDLYAIITKWLKMKV